MTIPVQFLEKKKRTLEDSVLREHLSFVCVSHGLLKCSQLRAIYLTVILRRWLSFTLQPISLVG